MIMIVLFALLLFALLLFLHLSTGESFLEAIKDLSDFW